VSLLGGGPAVLLQVAHPLVAAGVVRHSAYEDDLWKRFMRTMEALYLIVYGSRREADRAGEIVRAVHAAVRADGGAARSVSGRDGLFRRRSSADALGARHVGRDLARGLPALRRGADGGRAGGLFP
jgi:hypothetical protein